MMIIIMMDVDWNILPPHTRPPIFRDDRCHFQAKTTLKLYPDGKRAPISSEAGHLAYQNQLLMNSTTTSH